MLPVRTLHIYNHSLHRSFSQTSTMASHKICLLFLAFFITYDEVAAHISVPLSELSGPIPHGLPIAFPPTLPLLPPMPAPVSSPPSQSAAQPPFPVVVPPFLPPPFPVVVAPYLPPLPSIALPVPVSAPPPCSTAPPPSTPIAMPPMAMSPSQPPFLPQLPLAPSPMTSPPPAIATPPPALPTLPPLPISMPPSQSAAPPSPLQIPSSPSLPPLPSTPPSPPPSSSHPPRGIKGAYWPSGQAQTLPPTSIPTSYFTHLFYAFVLVDPTSFQIILTESDELWTQNFTSTIHAASPPAKALLSIGGASADSRIFSNMVTSPDNRAAFIQSSIDVARTYNFDGLDLDWESPENPQDMSNLALLYKEWRSAINHDSLVSSKPRLLLSSAVYFASNFFLPGYVPRTYPGESIRNYVDFLNPMCYDYHGGWEPSTTGAHALLYDKASDVSTSYGISSWKTDIVPSKKIVMGMPVYGRTWQLKDPNQHGIGAPAVGTGPGGGIMNYTAILGFNKENNATVVFDNATVSTYSYAGTSWIGYDDADSVEYKVKYAKEQGLGGYFFWALGFDDNWELAKAASTAWDNN